MEIRKTRQDQRGVYRYPEQVADGKGGYCVRYNVLKPGEGGITELDIKTLHSLDDSWVYSNIKNGHPPLTEEEKEKKREWEKAHPGEKYPANWNLSLDYLAENEDGDSSGGDKMCNISNLAYDPSDVPYEVGRFHEIMEEKMTDRQRQAVDLIRLKGYTITEAAKIMGISINVAKKHYDKGIRCIKENF